MARSNRSGSRATVTHRQKSGPCPNPPSHNTISGQPTKPNTNPMVSKSTRTAPSIFTAQTPKTNQRPIMAQDAPPPIAQNLQTTILQLAKRVEALLARQATSATPSRTLVALAGVPGSGKSTVSAALLVELAARGINDVVVVPMVRIPPS